MKKSMMLLALLAACERAAPPEPSPSQPEVPETTRRIDSLRIPVAAPLVAQGGFVDLVRLPTGADIARARVRVDPGQTVLDVDAAPGETIAYSQQARALTATSAGVAQAGCEEVFDTGVTHHVPSQYATIQAAIDIAAPGDTVLVAPGTYSEALQLRPGVRLRGSGAAHTTLDAQGQAINLVDVTRAPGVVISGFTFRGVASAGTCDDALQCSGDWYRAAIFGDGHWRENEPADDEPLAVSCSGSSALITQNVFRDNFIPVMAYFHTRLIVANNVFSGNTYGAVFTHLQDRGALLNNVFWQQGRVAIAISAGYVDVVNNVVANSGTAFHQRHVQQGRIACNLVSDNGLLEERGHAEAPLRLLVGADGNLESDPAFADPGGFDFRPEPGSVAINGGCAALGEADLDGTAIDIGAHGGVLGDW